jgi:hypothetical protein
LDIVGSTGKRLQTTLLDCTPRFENATQYQGKTLKKKLKPLPSKNKVGTAWIDVDCDSSSKGIRDGSWRWLDIGKGETVLNAEQIQNVRTRMENNKGLPPENIQDIVEQIEQIK